MPALVRVYVYQPIHVHVYINTYMYTYVHICACANGGARDRGMRVHVRRARRAHAYACKTRQIIIISTPQYTVLYNIAQFIKNNCSTCTMSRKNNSSIYRDHPYNQITTAHSVMAYMYVSSVTSPSAGYTRHTQRS